ncbi:MAG: MFS transporter [Pseudomonadota bacterium]|nr:MFS transporter [Pseudomonadota bacterium]
MKVTGSIRPMLPILIGASVMLTLSMGLRQSLGLFMQDVARDLTITVSDFAFAVAVQNLVWGLTQPVAGLIASRYGFRPVMVLGGIVYACGLAILATSESLIGVMAGAGLMIGFGMACASPSIALSVSARTVSPARRSMILGVVSAAGSLGALISAPIGQYLMEAFDWRTALVGFVAMAIIMLPAAWMAGRVDRLPPPPPAPDSADSLGARDAILMALRHGPFLVMTGAFFVCGMQLIFLVTHLPSYIALCGLDPMLSAKALGTIGGFNVIGSLFFGWAGGRWNKQVLLGLLYCARSAVIAWYFVTPPTPESTLLFAGLMGFLWLGVSPLIAGAVVEMFGLRWQPMLQGVTFFSHQIGSFLGAFGGGWVFVAYGSYDLALQIGVSIGMTAGIIQIAVALARTPPPKLRAA